MFQPNDAAGIVSATYDRMQEVQQIDKTFKDMVKDGRMSEAREFLQKNSKEIAAGAVAGNIQEQLSTITKAMNAIKASNMTPDKKREELDKLQQLRIKLAESTRGYLG
jgi:polyhydroxyalkanoate synthesis regulator phasin